MSGLLVSVRDAEEAETALAAGADLIDVKEPAAGALGPADPAVWREVRRVVGGRKPTSAALGELLSDPVESLARQAAGMRYVKIGLAGCHDARGWLDRWFRLLTCLPRGVSAVPVAYADWPAAKAPSPSVALALAALCPARLLLLDTCDKARGSLLDYLADDCLRELCANARHEGVRMVLAGSLDGGAIARLLPLAPAWFGVRGAACGGRREGRIEPAAVKSLWTVVHCGSASAPGSES